MEERAGNTTVEKIFAPPTSANIEWRQVESLLAAIGSVESDRNGKLHVMVDSQPEIVIAPDIEPEVERAASIVALLLEP